MSRLTSLTKNFCLLFDLTEATPEDIDHYFPQRKGFRTRYVIIGFNTYIDAQVKNFFYYMPEFEEPDNVIHLDHTHYPQYLMLGHLAWEDIVNYFKSI